LRRASVYANPLQEGAGTSLKVLEALASGLPLVSTACGVRGFPLQAPRDYLGAEEPADFARALLACLADPGARDAASIGGRVLAEAYDWDALGERFAAAVLSVCR
jgi:glycosyltransferase involved in cell wall biosynthesis